MQTVGVRRLGLALAIAFVAMTAASAPVQAGDDEECLYDYVGPWMVVYDSLCTKEMHRTVFGGQKTLWVGFTFFPDGTPTGFAVGNSSSYDPLKVSAPTVTVLAGGKTFRPDGGVIDHLFYGSAEEIFEALRQGHSAVITVTYTSDGVHSFTLDNTDLAAAHARLRQ